MGFDLGRSINKATEWLCSSRLVNGIMSNPIFTALLLTTIVVIILLAMFRGALQEAGKKRLARTFLYIMMAMVTVLFVHQYAVTRRCGDSSQRAAQRSLVESVGAAAALGGEYPVYPALPTTAQPGAIVGMAPVGVTGAAEGRPLGGQESLTPKPPQRPDNLDEPLDFDDLTVPVHNIPGRT